MINIRPAVPEDADAASLMMRRSITELCTADHQNDAATLAEWLANKTPDVFVKWLASPNNFCVVAEENDRLLGVGMLLRKLTTESTASACAFYERMGFKSTGDAVHGFGSARCWPYEKAL